MNPMQKAIELSRMGLSCGGPFGAVVVRGTEIIGEGINLVVVRKDPTAHAEINAIRDACRFLKTHDLTGCELYCSCEPCPMTLDAIRRAKISKVYFAASQQDFMDAGGLDTSKLPPLNMVQMEPENRNAARAVLENWKLLATKRTY